jgi:hypothetical protein
MTARRRAWPKGAELCSVVLWAVRRLALGIIGELLEAARVGRLGSGSVVDTAEELRVRLGPLLEAEGIDGGALDSILDDLVRLGGLPRRLDLRGRGDVERLEAVLRRLG